jgi:glycosyltransferase involved in cell wall biosynthesis
MGSLVSILIPVYNRFNLVGKTIESAINQSYEEFEIIIVDNCSTDGTWELINDYANKDNRIRVFQNQKNIGPVRNWMRCIEEARGEYSKILFSDDLMSPNYLEVCYKLLDGNTDAAFVFSKVCLINSNGVHSEMMPYNLKNKFIRSYIFNLKKIFGIGSLPNSPGCAFFRTSDLKMNLVLEIPTKKGLKFENFGAGNDLLLFLLTADRYKKIIYTNETSVTFLGHVGSFSTSNNLNEYYFEAKKYFCQINNYMLSYLVLKIYLFIKRDF